MPSRQRDSQINELCQWILRQCEARRKALPFPTINDGKFRIWNEFSHTKLAVLATQCVLPPDRYWAVGGRKNLKIDIVLGLVFVFLIVGASGGYVSSFLSWHDGGMDAGPRHFGLAIAACIAARRTRFTSSRGLAKTRSSRESRSTPPSSRRLQ
jgi:hypothetical protein